jgi:hypothetical protein
MKCIETNQRKQGATKIAVGKWEKGGQVGKKPTAANITKAQPKPANLYLQKRNQVAVEVDLQDDNKDKEKRKTVESKDEESIENGTSEMEVLCLPYWGVKFCGECW